MPAQTIPVANGTAFPVNVSFSLIADLSLNPAFLAAPEVVVRAFTLASRTDGFTLNNGGTNDDPTSVGGVITLAYTFTPASVDVSEPASLALLLVFGLAGALASRRRTSREIEA